MKFESKRRIHSNLPSCTVFSLVLMRLIENRKTPFAVGELAVAWQFHSSCETIRRHKMDIPSVFQLIETGVLILVGQIHIFGVQQVDQLQITSIYYLVDGSVEGLCHSGNCNHQDCLKSLYKCWMPVRWCCLDLQWVAGHRIQSLERIPLLFFTDHAGKLVVRQNHPLSKGIAP